MAAEERSLDETRTKVLGVEQPEGRVYLLAPVEKPLQAWLHVEQLLDLLPQQFHLGQPGLKHCPFAPYPPSVSPNASEYLPPPVSRPLSV